MNTDQRLKTLVENGIAINQRSIIVIIGPKSNNQIPFLHNLLKDCSGKDVCQVLWMHKKDQDTPRQNKKKAPVKGDDLKEYFCSSDVTRLDYKDAQSVLGNTYDACVLQNFEALTPNILAQTVETVRGGGLVVFPVTGVASLGQLLTVKMDIHGKLRTVAGGKPLPRFTERFLLSLARCRSCLVLDDDMKVLSCSEDSICLNKIKSTVQLNPDQSELENLTSLLLEQPDTSVAGTLVGCCRTMDQAKAVLGTIGALTNKSNLTTVVTTAPRGRGKSAALGLSIAAAVAYKFGNIFVTAPSPENLKTVFEYVVQGLEALGFTEDDFSLLTSKHESNCIVGIEVYKERGQKVEYIRPDERNFLSGAKVVFVDEAAAIPMTHVKEMMSARYLVMTSTVNGYEGTGRSLSHKLISDLRQSVTNPERGVDVAAEVARIKSNVKNDFNELGRRVLHEIELSTPVRYGAKDPVESWLNSLLCLNTGGVCAACECPFPDSCRLYYVNKDTLFSGHERTEEFLQELVSVFAASHYKNNPNDVQLLSDAANHHVFCLLGPSAESRGRPTVLCAIQVAYEGGINEKVVESSFRRGARGDGDLIPWIIEEKYKGRGFAQKLGVRVVRIATHPGLQRGGYGTRAMQLLIDYYEGKLFELDVQQEVIESPTAEQIAAMHPGNSLTPRGKLSQLMVELSRRKPERVDYVGASFGLTVPLLRFWKKQGMVTVHVSLTRNPLTGEFNGIVLRPINHVDDDIIQADFEKMDDGEEKEEEEEEDDKKFKIPKWLMDILQDFQRTHLDMLSDAHRDTSTVLALETLTNCRVEMPTNYLTKEELRRYCFSEEEDLLMEGYMKDLVSEKQISTIVFELAHLVFSRKMNLRPTELKEIILLGMGIQRKTAEQMGAELPNTDVEERRAFYKQVVRACIMVRTGEANKEQEADREEAEEAAAAAESRSEKLKLVDELRMDMEEASELGKIVNKQLETGGGGKVAAEDLKKFTINDGSKDIWTREIQKMGKSSNILKRASGEESGIVQKMKRNMKTKKKNSIKNKKKN